MDKTQKVTPNTAQEHQKGRDFRPIIRMPTRRRLSFSDTIWGKLFTRKAGGGLGEGTKRYHGSNRAARTPCGEHTAAQQRVPPSARRRR